MILLTLQFNWVIFIPVFWNSYYIFAKKKNLLIISFGQKFNGIAHFEYNKQNMYTFVHFVESGRKGEMKMEEISSTDHDLCVSNGSKVTHFPWRYYITLKWNWKRLKD